jgi:hypothetical protein
MKLVQHILSNLNNLSNIRHPSYHRKDHNLHQGQCSNLLLHTHPNYRQARLCMRRNIHHKGPPNSRSHHSRSHHPILSIKGNLTLHHKFHQVSLALLNHHLQFLDLLSFHQLLPHEVQANFLMMFGSLLRSSRRRSALQWTRKSKTQTTSMSNKSLLSPKTTPKNSVKPE